MNINFKTNNRKIEVGDLVTFKNDMHKAGNNNFRIVCQDGHNKTSFYLFDVNTSKITISMQCDSVEEFAEECDLCLIAKKDELNLNVSVTYY